MDGMSGQKSFKPPFFVCDLISKDAEIVSMAINIGIDSRLEAVTDSRFHFKNGKLRCEFSEKDFQIVLRRISEMDHERASGLEDSFVFAAYGKEVF